MTNHDFAAIGIETSHDWIVERTGIHQRYISRDGETTTSLATDAARSAMERAGVHAGELDLIVVGTASPDRLLPSAAVEVQAQLGASRAAAFDVDAACTGFVYGMAVAEGMITSGVAETALVIGVERLSKIIDWQDRSTCILFGDGAGAAVLRRSKQHQKGILSAFVRSDGTLADLLHRPGGGAASPFDEQVMSDRSHFIRMNGREVFKHAVRSMSEAATRALDDAKLTSADIDLMIPHQANIRIIEATAKHAGIPMEKVYVNVDRYGNTSAASVPIALDEAVETGRIREGSRVLLVAFGAGFTWGAMVLQF
jgi:3-oxoacyl-[acyl-carrier-protein] synthase-3